MERTSIPVFYEGQDDLIDILAVSMCSVCFNTEAFIEFYVLDCGISAIHKKLLRSLNEKFPHFSLEFIPVDLSPFEGLKGWPPGSGFLDCYSRLLIPELKSDIDRAIYLDSDVIAVDDIEKLWNEDLGEYEIGACPDLGYDRRFLRNCTAKLNVDADHVYANAGVLLLNCRKMRQNRSTAAFIDIAKRYNDSILVIIEDIFSIYYNGSRYKILPSRYNLPDRTNEIGHVLHTHVTDEYIESEWKHVVFQHLSPGKAWKFLRNNYDGRDLKLYSVFWFYASMTPYWPGMLNKFLFASNAMHTHLLLSRAKEYWRLFGFLPFLKRESSGPYRVYKLFHFLPILKIKERP